MVKCATCGNEVSEDKKIFEKGKFFDSKDCQKKFGEKSKDSKKEGKNVCEFC